MFIVINKKNLIALLLSQLNKLEGFLKIRMNVQKKYNNELPEEIFRPNWSDTCQFYSAGVNSIFRNDLMQFLSTKKKSILQFILNHYIFIQFLNKKEYILLLIWNGKNLYHFHVIQQ